MTSAEIRDKFKGLFADFGPEAQAFAVIDAVDRLESHSDIGSLIRAFGR
jgi:hypothetical protein